MDLKFNFKKFYICLTFKLNRVYNDNLVDRPSIF